MYYIIKAITFAIICLAYATGTREAAAAFCCECEMRYGYKMVIIAKFLGTVFYVAMQ